MPDNTDPQTLNQQGKEAFQSGQLDAAVNSFRARQRLMPPSMMI